MSTWRLKNENRGWAEIHIAIHPFCTKRWRFYSVIFAWLTSTHPLTHTHPRIDTRTDRCSPQTFCCPPHPVRLGEGSSSLQAHSSWSRVPASRSFDLVSNKTPSSRSIGLVTREQIALHSLRKTSQLILYGASGSRHPSTSITSAWSSMVGSVAHASETKTFCNGLMNGMERLESLLCS
ncbi:hypothetical protein CH063_03964 [Colletotrichum higginsianum]|uniref:Uncharacterized protein n=1 Tax=Colletotrichum higginsianum (strain IMI 349063) TaxID=759273 RepID=H1W2W9_COLHI|nr:hypothetical protein CH063_03964 [Colletotrichum higginsianum]